MPDRRPFDEILEDLRSGRIDPEAAADELSQNYSRTQLQREAARAAAQDQELAQLKSRIERYEKAPMREKAFRDYGVDLEALRPAERRALSNFDGELTSDAIAAFVDENELPMAEQGQQQEEQPAAAGVVRAAGNAPAGGRQRGPVITPEMASDWSAEKIHRFNQKFPEAMNKLMQNEPVYGITFE